MHWLVLYCLKCIFCDKQTCGLQNITPPFQQQTHNAVYYNVLCNLSFISVSVVSYRLIRFTRYSTNNCIFCNDDYKCMDDDNHQLAPIFDSNGACTCCVTRGMFLCWHSLHSSTQMVVSDSYPGQYNNIPVSSVRFFMNTGDLTDHEAAVVQYF